MTKPSRLALSRQAALDSVPEGLSLSGLADAAAVSPQRRRRRPIQRVVGRIGWYTAMIGIVGAMIAPLIWMVLGSLKSEAEFYSWPPTILPERITLDAYRNLFTQTDVLTWFRNSVLISVTISVVTVAVCAMGAYSLARFRYRFFETFARLILLGYMVPSILLLVPILLVIRAVGLAGTPYGLLVAYLSILIPFGLWLLRGYFAGMPHEIEESALIHGATRWQAFRRVVLPNALPGLISTTLFVFHVAWSEFLFASLILSRSNQMTLSAGIATLIGREAIVSWPMLLAAAVVVTLPVVLVFAFLQGFLIRGWGGGAVKG